MNGRIARCGGLLGTRTAETRFQKKKKMFSTELICYRRRGILQKKVPPPPTNHLLLILPQKNHGRSHRQRCLLTSPLLDLPKRVVQIQKNASRFSDSDRVFWYNMAACILLLSYTSILHDPS